MATRNAAGVRDSESDGGQKSMLPQVLPMSQPLAITMILYDADKEAESASMTARNTTSVRDPESDAGQKSVVQQLLSFPQPFTITRPKLYKPFRVSPQIKWGSSKTVLFFNFSFFNLN